MRGAGLHPSNEVYSDDHRVPARRKWTVLLLALLFLVTACEQAVHSHSGWIPDSKQITDSLDSNAAARCHLCLHSQAAPLGNVALVVAPHAAPEAAALPSLLPPHTTGEDWVHHVRPPPAA